MSVRVCGVVLASLALFACGDDGEEGETQTSPTTSALTSSTESGGVQTSASGGPLTTGDDVTSTAAMTGTSGSGSGSTSGAIGPLDQARYTDEVHSVIVEVCAACHTPGDAFPFTVWPDDPMLTYDTALNFISEPAESSDLLTVPLGANFFDQGGAEDMRYQTILAWISGEPSPM